MKISDLSQNRHITKESDVTHTHTPHTLTHTHRHTHTHSLVLYELRVQIVLL